MFRNCYNYSSFRVLASPNPANQILTVETQLVNDNETAGSSERFLKVKDKNNVPVKLVDRQGNIRANGKLKDGIFKCNVNNIPNDTYFLQIGEEDELMTLQILVNH